MNEGSGSGTNSGGTSGGVSDLAELRARAARLVQQNAFGDASLVYIELRDVLAERLGATNISVAQVNETLGGVYRQAGDLLTARSAYEAAREIFQVAHPTSVSSVDQVLRHLDPLPDDVLALRPVLVLVHENCLRRQVGPSPGAGSRHMHDMVYDQLYIGRGIERVHFWIHSDMLSRIHCRVLWNAEKELFEIEDCRSENGTLFEGARIRGQRTIKDGDVYALGNQLVSCSLTVSPKA